MAKSFTLFSRLPPELRRMVWAAALPDQDPGALYLWNWRWCLPYKDPDNKGSTFPVVTREPHVQVRPDAMELLWVNQEARDAMMLWASRRGITMRLRDETQGHIFVRPWDPERDHLYVPRDDWEDFCDEDWESLEPMAATIQKLALPAFTLYYSVTTLGSLMEFMPNLKTVSGVWGKLPKMKLSAASHTRSGSVWHQCEVEVQPRWELEDSFEYDPDDPTKQVATTVTMVIEDPIETGGVQYEEQGDLGEWMEEIHSSFAITELPEHVVDLDSGELVVAIDATKAISK